MRVLALLQSLLLAVGKRPTHWFIDGNNLLAHGKTAKDRDSLMQKLRDVPSDITLVFDGRPGEQTNFIQIGNLCTVDLGEGLASDDYIHDEIKKFWEDPATKKRSRVTLVSADRKLRQRALKFKPIVRTVINPITFFRRYLPRMKGLKKTKVLSEEV
jgi:hypothetical protein